MVTRLEKWQNCIYMYVYYFAVHGTYSTTESLYCRYDSEMLNLAFRADRKGAALPIDPIDNGLVYSSIHVFPTRFGGLINF